MLGFQSETGDTPDRASIQGRQPMTQAEPRPSRAGLFYGLAAYGVWGVLPLYFKALADVSPGEILAHRITWSLVFLGVVVVVAGRIGNIRAALGNPRAVRLLIASATLIAVNWLVYIIAVVNGHVLEGSLGYFLNPLLNVLLGVVFLRETLSRMQIVALATAAIGVSILAVGAGAGLWISVVLALSFGLYGFIRKIAPVESLEGLVVESIILAPFAIGFLAWHQLAGTSGFASWSLTTDVLLIAGGAVTAIPLLLFAAAARLLPLSTLGFLQYIAPSLQFGLAVLLFGEQLTTAHIVCFGLIWLALILFSIDLAQRLARQRTAPAEALA